MSCRCAKTWHSRSVISTSTSSKRTIRIEHLDADLTSPITTSEVVEGKLLLQGTDSGIKGETGGGGYTLSINQTYGNMILTVAGQDVAFVGMGACIAKR